ncbi:retrovirus-related Pol polyprotein from transposon 412 [Nephila pilipes]|uniref:Retrovirus-related Pol polyprotein from transposon 412 n=1 Tax=Nephila pilipes TaxID=299642 RepID=A0A8X6NLE7_NEPPI|nr:retrovirus-related Pol polyprotein from transposon 412 [Nephila pilipes]
MILKSFWLEDISILIRHLKSVTNHLNDLKIKLQLANEQVDIVSTINQANYAFYHNRLKSYKSFEKDDKVIVLAPGSTHKIYARWTSPSIIVEKRSAHSYLVPISDNSVQHIHANKVRRLNLNRVIYQTEMDFGDIENTPIKTYSK